MIKNIVIGTVTLFISIVLGLISWFANNAYNEQKDINKILFGKLNEQAKENVDVQKRMGLLEYIVRSKNGQFQ